MAIVRAGGAISTARPTWSRKSRGSSATTLSRRPRCRAPKAWPGRPRPGADGRARVRRAAAARGLDEAVTWSFIGAEEAALFGGAAHILANPISEEMKPHAALAAGPAWRRPPQRRSRRLRASACSKSAAATWPRPSGRRSASCWPATAAAQLAGRARRRASTRSMPRPRRLALLEAAGAPVANLQLVMGAGRLGTRAARPRLGLGPRPSSPPSANSIREWPRRWTCRQSTVAAEALPRRHPRAAHQRAGTAGLRAAALQAVTRDFASWCRPALPPMRLVRAIRGADKALITDARVFDRYEGEQGLEPGGRGDAAAGREELHRRRDRGVSKKIVAAAEKVGVERLRVEGVDRGVDPRLDLVALEAGGMISPTLKWTVPDCLTKPCAKAVPLSCAPPAPPAARGRGKGRRSLDCSGGGSP